MHFFFKTILFKGTVVLVGSSRGKSSQVESRNLAQYEGRGINSREVSVLV